MISKPEVMKLFVAPGYRAQGCDATKVHQQGNSRITKNKNKQFLAHFLKI